MATTMALGANDCGGEEGSEGEDHYGTTGQDEADDSEEVRGGKKDSDGEGAAAAAGTGRGEGGGGEISSDGAQPSPFLLY